MLIEYIPKEPKALYELITSIRVLENIESWIQLYVDKYGLDGELLRIFYAEYWFFYHITNSIYKLYTILQWNNRQISSHTVLDIDFGTSVDLVLLKVK